MSKLNALGIIAVMTLSGCGEERLPSSCAKDLGFSICNVHTKTKHYVKNLGGSTFFGYKVLASCAGQYFDSTTGKLDTNYTTSINFLGDGIRENYCFLDKHNAFAFSIEDLPKSRLGGNKYLPLSMNSEAIDRLAERYMSKHPEFYK